MAYWMIEDSAKHGQAGGDGVFPPMAKVVQAAAFGAILGGATTGAVNVMRVKSGEIDSHQAVQETVQIAARGAASMAIASVAAHVVRIYPLFGVLTLMAVGAAVLAMTGQQKKPARAPRGAASPRPAAPAVASGSAPAKAEAPAADAESAAGAASDRPVRGTTAGRRSRKPATPPVTES